MRVLQVVRPAAGGIRRHLEILTTGLIERGIQTEIAAPPDFHLESAARIIPVSIQSRPHPIKDLRAASAIARAAANFDLIHGHGLRGAWIAYLAFRKCGKPFLFTAHNLAPVRAGFVARTLLRQTCIRATAIIAVSEAVKQSLTAQLAVATQLPITVIPGAIDLEPFSHAVDREAVRRSFGVPQDSKLVAAIGRLAPEKGYDQLVVAASVVHDPGLRPVHFVIAGEGCERTRLEKLIAQHGVGDRFKLLGYWPDAPSLLKSADVVVVPSYSEGQGLAALEAMAAGKPVVATNVGGLMETVVDGVSGVFAVPGESLKSLGPAILNLLLDADACRRMGEAGRARVEQLYTAPLMISRTIELYIHSVP